MKKHLFIFLLSALPFALLAQAPKKGPLDGKTFTVEITKEGKKKPINPSDELKFAAGKFKSACPDFIDWGFFAKPSFYTITSIDSTNAAVKAYSWKAETISDIKEVMTWEGTINGEDIEGSADLVNAKGEKKYAYTFSGKLKGKPGKK